MNNVYMMSVKVRNVFFILSLSKNYFLDLEDFALEELFLEEVFLEEEALQQEVALQP